MPKRTIKEIKLYTLKSGAKRYGFKTYLGLNSNGKPIKITRKGFKTYNEAADKYNKLRSEGSQGYVKPKQIKLDELWKIWFKAYQTQVKESNAQKVYQYYKNHIYKYFGLNYMDKIKVVDLQDWIEKLSTELVNYRRMAQLLSRLYRYAFTLGYVKDNPVDKLIIPRRTSRERRNTKINFYNYDELQTFLQDAKKFNFKFYTYFYLLASTGLRRGEGMGLTWNDIDFKHKLIHVRRTCALGIGNKVIVQDPKTVSSKRDIPISNKLIKVLKEYKKQYPPINEKLFCKRDGGWKNPSDARDWLQQIYREYPDLKQITVHGFRHTFATLLIEGTDIKPKEVQYLLGHETIQMTLDIYTHITKKDKTTAKSKIDSLKI